jgi:hypothetical protein
MNFKLTIRAVGVMSDFVHLTVCNGFLEDIAKGYEYLELYLPAGIYSITWKMDGHIIKENIRLEKDFYKEIKTPPVYSSLVADKFESSRAYYSENAVRYSKETTVTSKGDGSIYLFFRYTDFVSSQELNRERRSLGDGFTLLDTNRKVLYRLQGSNIREDLYNGWMAFHVCLPAGTYFLHYSGRAVNPAWEQDQGLPAREIPLQVYKTWQTEVFLTFGKGPIFPSMSIFIAAVEQGFVENDETNYRIDGVRHKFHNGVCYVPETVLAEFEQQQWSSPMQGLMAAYVYFNSPESNRDPLFRKLLDNLPAMLGTDTPDVKALRVLAAQYFKEPVPDIQIDQPGMFLAGVRATIKASLLQPSVIPENSLLEGIADNLYYDMIWTSYEPDDESTDLLNIVEDIIAETHSPEEIGDKLMQSRAVSTLLYYIGQLEDEIAVEDLSARLQIPVNVIKKTIKYILSHADQIKGDQLEKLKKLNPQQ